MPKQLHFLCVSRRAEGSHVSNKNRMDAIHLEVVCELLILKRQQGISTYGPHLISRKGKTSVCMLIVLVIINKLWAQLLMMIGVVNGQDH